MPGGSVNGRPFRDSPNSYSRCGVPCGHPDRYSTNNVVRVGVTSRPKGRVTLDGPLETIETEGERQLKQLAKKQSETQLNLQEHISRHRTFTEKVVYKPKTAEVKGVTSLEDYNKIRKQDDELEFLRQCGLSESEIKYKREADSSEPCCQPLEKQAKYGVDPQVKNDVLQDIQEKIELKKRQFSNPDSFTGAVHISRHEMELENSLNSNRSQSRFLNCLITTKSGGDSLSPENPMNQLQDIIKDITKPKRNRKKKSAQDKKPEESINSETEEVAESSAVGKKVYLAENYRYDSVVPVAKPEIIRCRLTTEEIRQIERFKSYEAGRPSNILYLKNLSKKVTESDLSSLFIHFEKYGQPPTIKLLKGKMRGQAFVSFDSLTTASSALDLLNGYMLKGQPIVIQYGRGTS